MQQKGYTLDAIFLGELISGCDSDCSLHLPGLRKEAIVCVKGEPMRVVALTIIFIDVRMVSVVEGDIESGATSFEHCETRNFTHAARRKTVVPLHAHDHGHHGDVSKTEDEKCTQQE